MTVIEPMSADDTYDVIQIVRNLRPEDVHEFAAVGITPNKYEDTALNAWFNSVERYVVYRDDVPVFAFGIVRGLTDAAWLWGFGTPDAKHIFPALTKFAKRTWLPWLFETVGIRRLEVRIPVSSEHSRKWLMHFGARLEAILQHASATGEPLRQIAFTKDQYDNVHV